MKGVEVVQEYEKQVTAASSASFLEAWLYLTRACNLECPYCFVRRERRSMSVDIGLRAIDQIFAVAQRREDAGVVLKYAGGEPTINWKLIRVLHQRAKKHTSESGLKLTEVLITNATLLDRARLQYIRDENLHLSVSLDGLHAKSSQRASFRESEPNLKRVLQTVELALEMGISISLLFTVTQANLDAMVPVVSFALQNHLKLNLNFYRSHSLGDPLLPNLTELIARLRQVCQLIEGSLPSYNFMERLLDRCSFTAPHQRACGAGTNYLSIDVDGKVLPCHMLTGYNLPGMALAEVKTPHFEGFSHPSVDQREGCRECEWRYWCGGGCPVYTQNVLGRADVASPYCQVYKAILPELIRLQALQLIQLMQSTAAVSSI